MDIWRCSKRFNWKNKYYKGGFFSSLRMLLHCTESWHFYVRLFACVRTSVPFSLGLMAQIFTQNPGRKWYDFCCQWSLWPNILISFLWRWYLQSTPLEEKDSGIEWIFSGCERSLLELLWCKMQALKNSASEMRQSLFHYMGLDMDVHRRKSLVGGVIGSSMNMKVIF